MSITDNARTRVDRQALVAAFPSSVAAALEAVTLITTQHGGSLWLVGGAVRDHLVGRPLRDLDLATDLDAAALAIEGARARGGRARAFPRFGTASIEVRDAQLETAPYHLDVAGMRTERYARPGALPVVTLGATIEQDLARRDFSVNAIAYCLVGPRLDELLDPLGGIEDLRRRRLRVLHPRSFRDDATRLWRGARYAARLRLRPDEVTAGLIEDGVRWLAPISGRRLWAEFERTAAEPRPGAVLALLEEWDALAATHPALALNPRTRSALERRRGPLDPASMLAALVAGAPEGASEALARLATPTEARRAVEDTARLLATTAPPSLEALRDLEAMGAAGRAAARWLDPEGQAAVQRELRRWERTRSPLDARALGRMGVASGPALGRWLRCLRAERYLGTLSTGADARRRVAASVPGQASGEERTR